MIPKLSHVLVHTVSEASKDDILKLGEKKPIRVISNAINQLLVIPQSPCP